MLILKNAFVFFCYLFIFNIKRTIKHTNSHTQTLQETSLYMNISATS